jgi:hypothetical protein
VFIRGFRAKRVFLWTRLKGAADPLPDDPDNRREDEIQVTRVPDIPHVSNFPAIGCRRTEHDVSFLVPRPAHRGIRLSRGGWRASLLPLLLPYLALFNRSAQTILWSLPTMMTFSSLNRWYVHVCIAILSVETAGNAHVQETFTADAVSSFLLQNEIGVLVENGGNIVLHHCKECAWC